MLLIHPENSVSVADITTPLIIVVSDDFENDIQTYFSKDTVNHILRAVSASKFTGKTDDILTILAPVGLKTSKLVLVSLGQADNALQVENTAGTLADIFYKTDESISLIFAGKIDKTDNTIKSAFMMGFHLRCYHFNHYFTGLKDSEKPCLDTVHIYSSDDKTLSQLYLDIIPVIEGVFFARDLVSEPANILYPESYAERCQDLEKIGLKITVLNEDQMAQHGMFCLLGVGQGSVRESKTVILEWNGAKNKSDTPIALVGKGVCFDTGGISLKPGKGMWDMIYDMGGSAAVVGTMITLAKRGASANVVGIIGLVENMPDANAQRPGDVVKTMAGKTVEVLNTDAEGRLVLADIMWYVQEHYKPNIMIDLATLTGAIVMSLGHEYAGLFSNNDDLSHKLLDSGMNTGDKLWKMPMHESFAKRLKSRIADIANIAMSPEGGSITAACFLEHFVKENVAWAHLDIAGTAWTSDAKPTTPKGATGFGVRILNDYILKNFG
jgi:leucyl aminopeptidase